jgi:hypothetical protein
MHCHADKHIITTHMQHGINSIPVPYKPSGQDKVPLIAKKHLPVIKLAKSHLLSIV